MILVARNTPTLHAGAGNELLGIFGNFFQYVKTTLANSKANGHAYIRLVL
ncbi:hypothetical protein [Scytonema sp. NUACC26]